MYTMIDRKGQTFGPVDVDTLQAWCKQGRLSPASRLIDIATGAQLSARDLPQLNGLFAPDVSPLATTYVYDLVAALAVGVLALIFFIAGLDSVGKHLPEDAKAAGYLLTIGFTAGMAFAGWGIYRTARYGFVAGAVMFGLHMPTTMLIAALATPAGIGLSGLSVWIAALMLAMLALFGYCLLRVTNCLGPEPSKG